jgi:hypothetical protein
MLYFIRATGTSQHRKHFELLPDFNLLEERQPHRCCRNRHNNNAPEGGIRLMPPIEIDCSNKARAEAKHYSFLFFADAPKLIISIISQPNK